MGAGVLHRLVSDDLEGSERRCGLQQLLLHAAVDAAAGTDVSPAVAWQCHTDSILTQLDCLMSDVQHCRVAHHWVRAAAHPPQA